MIIFLIIFNYEIISLLSITWINRPNTIVKRSDIFYKFLWSNYSSITVLGLWEPRNSRSYMEWRKSTYGGRIEFLLRLWLSEKRDSTCSKWRKLTVGFSMRSWMQVRPRRVKFFELHLYFRYSVEYLFSFINSHDGGVRYRLRWRVIFVKTL